MSNLALKTYQADALDALALFLQQVSTMSLDAAWGHAMQRQGAQAVPPYRKEELGDTPCVCLRIPTGGGKTLMASHAIVRIAEVRAQGRLPTALWLVPSDMIRSQTLKALQTPGHPYRAALERAYGSRFQVCELDALHTVPPQSFGTQAIVVVATIQSLRVNNKAGRRAYAMSEQWETHFKSLALSPQQIQALGLACVTPSDLTDKGETVLTQRDVGRVKNSLANWLALQQPIVIVDEAHNAKTPLSLAMLRDLQPSCVLDLTATPVPSKTNVLYSVSARQLEAEDMIKLPIILAEHETGWQDAVRDALLRRKQLEAEAAHEPQYVRPIALFQAQDQGGEVTVEVLRTHLVEQCHIPEAEIAVATGTQRELDGVNLADPRCRIRYVITVDALREGWDCPFAYVLCTTQNLSSNQAVEQLLGRVLRMPYARKRRSPALNKAYAHVVAKRFAQAAEALVDALTQGMGFDPLSAAGALQAEQELIEGDLFGDSLQVTLQPRAPVLELTLPGADLAAVQAALADQPDVSVTEREGEVLVRAAGRLSETLESQVLLAAPAAQRERVAREIDAHGARVQAQLAPAERGVQFAPIPQLCVTVQGELELIERETLSDLLEFDLLKADPRPDLPGFNVVQQNDLFEVYLDGARVSVKASAADQMSLDQALPDVTENDLIRTVAGELRMQSITATELQAYVQRIVAHLLRDRDFTLTSLVRSCSLLAQTIGRRIDALVAKHRADGFQALLFARSDAQLTHDPAWRFRFEAGRYPVRKPYSGRIRFSKHFYPEIAELKSEGEEFQCALALDREPKVRHWVRNIDKQPQFSFWLPTATDYFYPDFVAELTDGRLLVVEYKGEPYATNADSSEKRLVGERWAQLTGQVFVMVEQSLNGQNMAQQISAAIGESPSAAQSC